MNKKSILVICVILSFFFLGVIIIMFLNNEPKIENFDLAEYGSIIEEFPSNKILGAIKDSEIAKEKSEEVWLEIYGKDILNNKPYKVFFDATNKVWLVQGSLPEDFIGGVPYILIQKTDGKILAVWHDK